MPNSELDFLVPEYAEDPARYVVGGLHPILIGEVLHQRYKIMHKLGHGSSSTVWLARDQVKSTYVAIKICEASPEASKDKSIHDKLSRLRDQDSALSLDWKLLSIALEQFSINGPNGTHECFVLAPSRCSIGDACYEHDAFKLEAARSFTAQLVIAVAKLHSLGVVHGDLNCGNVLLSLSASLDCLTEAQFYVHYNSPEPIPLERCDGLPVKPSPHRPQYQYERGCSGQPAPKYSAKDVHISLADFGAAFFPAKEKRTESVAPSDIRPPEVFFEPGKPLDFASDVWSLGCMVWATMGNRPILGGETFGVVQAIGKCMELLADQAMPQAWWDKWQALGHGSGKWVSNGVPKTGPEVKLQTMEDMFERHVQWPRRCDKGERIENVEKEAFFEMTRAMMKWNPKDRLTAKQMLETKWMKEWGIPSVEETLGQGVAGSKEMGACS